MSDAPVCPSNVRPPDLDAFEAMARAAFQALPKRFRDRLGRVEVRVADFADEATLDEMEIDDAFSLTGLYRGVPLTLDSVASPTLAPPEVWLYRRPILDEWADRGDVALDDLVAHVLIHEIGHHFGWSDAEMDAVLGEDH